MTKAMEGPDDLRNNLGQSPGQAILSHESSVSDESLCSIRSTENKIGRLKQNTARTEPPSSEFHFSIHKWAGRGVPLLMSLRGGKHPTFGGSSKVYSVQDTTFPNENLSADRGSTEPHFEIDSSEVEKETSTAKQEVSEHVVSLRLLLCDDEVEGQGDKEVDREAEEKENMEGMTGLSKTNARATGKKKLEGKKINSNKKAEATKSVLESPKSSGETLGKFRVKGKVKEFFKISNQESPPRIGLNAVTRSLRSRWKIAGRNKSDNEVSENMSDADTNMPAADAKIVPDALSTAELDGEVPAENVKMAPDAPSITGLDSKVPVVKNMPYDLFMVEENVMRSNKLKFAQNSTIEEVADVCFDQMDASPSSDSIRYGCKVTVENIDEPSLDNFQVQELSLDEDLLSNTEEESEAIRASDSKIHLWSNGRKGNIRSLLSTLQFVLWPESGWKPVALVDIIESNAVKKAYNRAMLCLHPDKLQQKGVASHQKYIAEKVFDILQEAWDHFNSLGTLI